MPWWFWMTMGFALGSIWASALMFWLAGRR
jgi:hypothetical protein